MKNEDDPVLMWLMVIFGFGFFALLFPQDGFSGWPMLVIGVAGAACLIERKIRG